MAFDFKKEMKNLYPSDTAPAILTVPRRSYIAVRGKGNPNREDGEYKRAIPALYSVAYAIRNLPKSGRDMPGYFEYVVPPLEGFWFQEGTETADMCRKEDFHFISVIPLPDFVTFEDFQRAVRTAEKKKKADYSMVEFFTCDEGLCVQCLHIGVYDDEPTTVEKMHDFAESQGYTPDFSADRLHHEVYITDPRKTPPEKMKTIIRHPIKKK